MASKNVLILTLILVAGAATVVLMDKNGGGRSADSRLGTNLLGDSVIPLIDRIIVSKGDKKVVLSGAEGGRWRIENDADFPADANKIVRFLDDAAKTKFVRLLSSNKEKLATFGLDAATDVLLKTGDKEAVSFSIGDTRSGGGRYLSVGGEYKAFLVDQNLRAEPDFANWELKTLLKVDKDQIKKIDFRPHSKKPITFDREKKEDKLTVQGIRDAETEKSSASGLDSIIANISFTNRHPIDNEEAKTALLKPNRGIVTLFDGRSYEFLAGTVGEKTKKYFLKIKGERHDATLDAEAEGHLRLMNDVMEKWAFEVGAHIYNKFEKGRSDYVEAEKTAKAGKSKKSKS